MKKSSIFSKYLLEILDKALKYYITRSIYSKMAITLVSGAIAINTVPLIEFLFRRANASFGDSDVNTEVLSTIFLFATTVVMLCTSVYFAHKSHKNKSQALQLNTLVHGKNSEFIKEINNSKIYIYCGSITQISDIELIVTSENTDMDLGSISGTSVSGRVRNLAATKNEAGEVSNDNLDNFIRNYKNKTGKYNNFQLGHCIECYEPYEAAHNGIKAILFAAAVKKHSDGTAIIDEHAVDIILERTVKMAVTNNLTSIFIPIFGLGSAKVKQDSIAILTSAINNSLQSTNQSLRIHLGVYRLEDAVRLSRLFYSA